MDEDVASERELLVQVRNKRSHRRRRRRSFTVADRERPKPNSAHQTFLFLCAELELRNLVRLEQRHDRRDISLAPSLHLFRKPIRAPGTRRDAKPAYPWPRKPIDLAAHARHAGSRGRPSTSNARSRSMKIL